MIRRMWECALLSTLLASVALGETGTWNPVGPEGGYLTDLATDPDQPEIEYVLGNFSLYRRAGGDRWQLVPHISGRSLATAAGGRVYVGGGGVLWRSRDSGRSFEHILVNVPSQYLEALAVDPNAPERLYAATHAYADPTGTSILRSDDEGSTWTLVGTAGSPSTVKGLWVDPESPKTLYIGLEIDGLKISADGGASWSVTSDALPCPRSDEGPCLASLIMLPDVDRTLLAGTYLSGLYRSSDTGAHWQRAGSGLGDSFVTALVADASGQTVYAGLAVTQPIEFIAPPFAVARSDDGGATFRPAGDQTLPAVIAALAVGRDRDRVLAATGEPKAGAGLYASRDGGSSWRADQEGLYATCIRDMAAAATPRTTLHLGMLREATGLFTMSGGARWRATSSADVPAGTIDVLVDPNDPRRVFVTTSSGGFEVSQDGGDTWTHRPSGSSGDPFSIWELAIDPRDGDTLYAATSRGVRKSMDGGETWRIVRPADGGPPALSVATDAATGIVYALDDRSVVRSVDGGGVWETLLTRSSATDRFDFLTLSPTEPPTVLVAGYEALRISRDGGGHWDTAALPANGQSVFAVAVDPSRALTLYAAQVYDANTVYRSDDAGQTWRAVGDPLPETPFALAVDPHAPRTIFAGTCGNGLLRLTQSPTGGSADHDGCAVVPPHAGATLLAAHGLAIGLLGWLRARR